MKVGIEEAQPHDEQLEVNPLYLFLGFCLISLLEVRFYFFTCVSESEFRARFI